LKSISFQKSCNWCAPRTVTGSAHILGNSSPSPLDLLSDTPLPTDNAAAIDAGFSRHLVHRMDGIWEMRKQAKYLEAAADLSSGDPALLYYNQRKYNPYQPRHAADHE